MNNHAGLLAAGIFQRLLQAAQDVTREIEFCLVPLCHCVTASFTQALRIRFVARIERQRNPGMDCEVSRISFHSIRATLAGPVLHGGKKTQGI